jgi:ribose transport system permease protein
VTVYWKLPDPGRKSVKLEPGAVSESVAVGPPAREAERNALRTRRLLNIALRYGMVWVLILLVIVAQYVYPTFLTVGNLRNMWSQNAALAIISVGMTLVIICGGFDLSVGSIYGLGAVAYATLSSQSLGVDLLIVVLVGATAGLVNGLIITRLKVNPFVATLATSSIFLSVAFVYSKNAPVSVQPGFGGLGLGAFAGMPISGIVTVAVFLVGGVLLSRTTFGQSIYAVGGSAEAARLAGLRVKLVRCATYVIVGALAAFAGSIDTSRLGVAQADQGQTMPLLAITVVILGGTALMGGEGAMWRTVVGLLIVATLTNLLDSLAINTAVQLLVQGAVLVAAVSLDNLVRSASLGKRKS